MERFWFMLSKEKLDVIELQNLGGLIVNNYFKIKNLFEEILEKNPDSKELVQTNITFH